MELLLLACLVFSFSLGANGQPTGIRGPFDVCERDTFNASYPPDHVILIHDALYGRMTSSRCIQNSVPDGSCDSDVIRTLDGLCSGRQKCQVPGIHPDLMFSKVCYESSAYLRASYQCIKVSHPSSSTCNDSPLVIQAEEEIHLPVSTLAAQGLASTSCPLVIQTSNDKLLNLTLWSFLDNDGFPSDACFEVGMLREKTEVGSQGGTGASGGGPIVSCEGEGRAKNILPSTGGPVFLFFLDTHKLQIGTFLLQIQVASQAAAVASPDCPDLHVPRGSRTESLGNEVSVICDVTGQTWRLECQEGAWRGELPEEEHCAYEETTDAEMGETESHLVFSLGLLAVLSLGVALILFIGGFFFFVLCFSCKRLKRGSVEDYKGTEVNFLLPYQTKMSHSDGSDPRSERSDYSRDPLYRPISPNDTLDDFRAELRNDFRSDFRSDFRGDIRNGVMNDSRDDRGDHHYMLYDRDYRPLTPASSPQSMRSTVYMPLQQQQGPIAHV